MPGERHNLLHSKSALIHTLNSGCWHILLVKIRHTRALWWYLKCHAVAWLHVPSSSWAGKRFNYAVAWLHIAVCTVTQVVALRQKVNQVSAVYITSKCLDAYLNSTAVEMHMRSTHLHWTDQYLCTCADHEPRWWPYVYSSYSSACFAFGECACKQLHAKWTAVHSLISHMVTEQTASCEKWADLICLISPALFLIAGMPLVLKLICSCIDCNSSLSLVHDLMPVW